MIWQFREERAQGFIMNYAQLITKLNEKKNATDLGQVILKRNVPIETKINVIWKGFLPPRHVVKQHLQGFAAMPIINQEILYPERLESHEQNKTHQ